jgi:hypothetical protein
MIVRAPREDRFTILNRSIISDPRLSFRALGLLTFILDKPDDWRIEAEGLASGEGREGRDAVRAALKELRSFGYLRTTKTQDDRGRWVTETFVYDVAQELTEDGNPGLGEPAPGEPAVGEPAVGNSGPSSRTGTDNGTEREASLPADERPGAARAERDELYQAIVSACGMVYGEMTKRQQRSCAVAMAELAAVGATPDEVHRRASIYPQKYQTCLTPNALANQWAALRVEGGPPKVRGETVMDRVRARLAADAPVTRLRAVGE